MDLLSPLRKYLREAAAQRVITSCYPRLVRYCHGLVRNREDACELAQEACCQFWTAHEAVTEVSRLQPYLFSIAHNLCISRLRRGNRCLEQEPDFWDSLPDQDAQCPPELADERAEIVRRIVAELPEGTERTVLTDYYYGDDTTTREIANRRQIPHGTVTVYLKRARARVLKRFVVEAAAWR